MARVKTVCSRATAGVATRAASRINSRRITAAYNTGQAARRVDFSRAPLDGPDVHVIPRSHLVADGAVGDGQAVGLGLARRIVAAALVPVPGLGPLGVFDLDADGVAVGLVGVAEELLHRRGAHGVGPRRAP